MPVITKQIELDTALHLAVVLGWEDLMKVSRPCSARVEYQCPPGTPLDSLIVWAAKAKGDLDLVCDYHTSTSEAHPGGARFSNGHASDQLAQALEFILTNQHRFTRPLDGCRNGLVLIYPPTELERAEAATWMRGRQDEEASSQMLDEGCPNVRTANRADAAGSSGTGGRLHLVGSPVF